jgi:hypothetical protein
MKKLMLMFLAATLILAPAFAAAQTGGSPQAPAASPSDRPKNAPSSGQPTPPKAGEPSDPAASPSGTRDSMSQYNTKADCEKAGGKWGEVSQSCSKK